MTAATKKKMSAARKKTWLEIHAIQGELNCSLPEAREEHRRRKNSEAKVIGTPRMQSVLTALDQFDLTLVHAAPDLAAQLLKVCDGNLNVAYDILNNTSNILERLKDERRAEANE